MPGKPAVKILLPFMLGILLGRALHPPVILLAVILALSIPLLISIRGRWFFGILSVAAFIAAGALRVEWPAQRPAADDVCSQIGENEIVCLEGLIVNPVEQRNRGQRFIVRCDSLWTAGRIRPARGYVAATAYDTTLFFRQGDRILLKGRLRSSSGLRNPGGLDLADYWAARGVHRRLTVTAGRSIILARNQDGFFTRILVRPSRQYIQSLLDSSLTGRQRALLAGLLLGERREIDEQLRGEFTSVGVIHVLSVSGLHVGFVVLGAIGVLRLFHIARRWRWPFLLLILFFYTHLTGAAAPVVRASLMAAFLLLAPGLQRRHDPLNAIALAAFVILLLQPLELISPGFQLSFAAVIGIVILYDKLMPARTMRRWREQESRWKIALVQMAAVSLAAQIATAPLTAYYFNLLPLYALVANVIVVPLSSIIVLTGFAAVGMGLLSHNLALVTLRLDGLLLQVMEYAVSQFSALPWAAVSVSTPSMGVIAFYFTLVFIAIYWKHPIVRKRLILLTAMTMAVWIWVAAFSSAPVLRVTFFDVGQGDAALCEFPDGRTLLIDAGESTDLFDAGKAVIVPYLKRQGILALDAMLITHGHSDHLGGAAAVLRALPVKRLITSMAMTDPQLYRALDSLCAVQKIPRRRVAAGDTLSGFAGAQILICAPSRQALEQVDENRCSIVLKLVFAGTSFLFTGDMSGDSTLFADVDRRMLSADLIKIPHHGSRTNNPDWLIQKAGARYGVISVGRYNKFGLPSAEALTAWEEAGCEVVRTDESGAVVFTSDGDHLVRR